MRTIEFAAVFSACIALSQAIQPGAAPAEQAPLRHLQIGDLNFLHTTDTHGWHAGHLLEPSFSADWGDYISFTEQLREKLEADGKDLLVIDTGDRIEGNGLYDASDPRGQYTFGIFSQQHIDILCSGNHELYKNSSAEDDYTKLVPAYKDNYLASNLEIIDPKTGKLESLAPRYRTFTTKMGVKIMAFGFIFDFTRNDKNTVVIPVEQAVKYPWFQTAIAAADIDLFVVIGHVALRAPEFEVIHQAIRSVKPDTPIQFFGGHYHIRDYRIFDDKAHALASGRFMETIGFQSISNLKSANVTFSRRYIDNNLHSLHHHSNTTPSTFPTSKGLNTTAMITTARTALNLDQTFGCAPQTYWMSRTPYPANDSVFSLLTDQIFPSIINPDRTNKTRVIITNTGAIRFDIFAGPFTRDSTYIVSPFTSDLSYIPDVPYNLAKKMLPILNGQNPQTLDTIGTTTSNDHWKFHINDLAPPEQQARSPSRNRQRQTLQEHAKQEALALQNHREHESVLDTHIGGEDLNGLRSSKALTPGYTTYDDLGSSGDDTLHSPIAFYDVPNCVQTIIPGSESSLESEADSERTDLIFNQFLTPYILAILNYLPSYDNARALPAHDNGALRRKWSEDDVGNYVPGETFTTLLARWVAENWNGNCGDKEEDGHLEL